jgi:hypothetical protein
MVHKKHMTDMEKFQLGALEQGETWWGKKIVENANEVRAGKYGSVVREWSESSGWMDGVIEPNFEIVRKGKKMHVHANESGVFISEGEGRGCSIDRL